MVRGWDVTLTDLVVIAWSAVATLYIYSPLRPVLFGLNRLSCRRIWAIARLSIKETVRQKILWVFSFLLLIVMFGSWFLDSGKAEYQIA